tara:strand:+ start:37113 stop:39035 length:1923 start_codon:yes stop_codon:yes gene_type:complete
MFIIVLSLTNPVIISENRESIPDTVAVLLDLSPSQNINNRKENALKTYDNIKKQLEKKDNIEVRYKTVKGEKGTNIFQPLSSLTGDIPNTRLAGAIIITDGQIQDTPEINNLNFVAPINFLITGNKDENDRRLIIEESPRFGIVGEEISIKLKVEDINSNTPNALVTINMNNDDKQSRSIPIGESINITFLLERAGITTLNIEVEKGKNELTLKNNEAVISINAIRERLKVMLVSGEPNMGLRNWRNLLNSDPSVDLIHFTILRPPNKQDFTPVGELSLIPFPTRELFQLNLNEFDLIIFDQYHLRGILPEYYLKNIVEYVVNGGALLDTAGPSYAGPYSLSLSPLQSILPTEPTGEIITKEFTPKITKHGMRHPVTANLQDITNNQENNNWGSWYRMVEGLAVDGDVLLEGPESRPLLVLNRIGQGRVAQILSDQSWVWTKSEENKGPQADLLRRLVHWLMKEPDLEENELSAKFENNTLIIKKNSLVPNLKPVTVISPSNESTQIELEDIGNGQQIAKILEPESGIWKLSYDNSSISIIIGNYNSYEYLDVRASDENVKPIAEYTLGSINWINTINNFQIPKIKHLEKEKLKGNNNINLMKNKQYYVKSLDQISLMPWYLALILSILLLFISWYRESR